MKSYCLLLLLGVCGEALASVPKSESPSDSLRLSQAHAMEQGLSLVKSRATSERLGLRLLSPMEVPNLRLLEQAPFPPDDGGGIDASTRPILALVLGLLIGFGVGHLVAKDRSGFILFLIVDLAIIVVSTIFFWGPWLHWGWGFGGLLLFASHVIQGLDAWGEAGGERIIQVARERAVEVARSSSKDSSTEVTTRILRFAF